MQCPHIVEVSVSETIGRLSAKYRGSKRDLWGDWQKRTSGYTTSLTSSWLTRRGRHMRRHMRLLRDTL
jgi:hypothetical protein